MENVTSIFEDIDKKNDSNTLKEQMESQEISRLRGEALKKIKESEREDAKVSALQKFKKSDMGMQVGKIERKEKTSKIIKGIGSNIQKGFTSFLKKGKPQYGSTKKSFFSGKVKLKGEPINLTSDKPKKRMRFI